MNLTELVALASGLGGASLGFVLGLRVCGPKLQITYTERHPRDLAQEVRDGRRSLTSLTPASRRLVLTELARMANGLTNEQCAEFLALDGVADRFVGHDQPHWTTTDKAV
jgi:hypothetical protein